MIESFLGFTPDKIIAILKKAISETLDKEVNDFTLIYNRENKQIIFKIDNKKYLFDDSAKYCKMIDVYLQQKAKDFINTVNYATLTSNKIMTLYYTDSETGKQSKQYKL